MRIKDYPLTIQMPAMRIQNYISRNCRSRAIYLSIILILADIMLYSAALCQTKPSLHDSDYVSIKMDGYITRIFPKINGKACDTCQIDNIFNNNKHISYFIINAKEQYDLPEFRENGINTGEDYYVNNSFQKGYIPFLRNITTHSIASEKIHLDFITNFEMDGTAFLENSYTIFHNKTQVSDWADINKLPLDSAIQANLLFGNIPNPRSFELDIRKTGTFDLAINDSLVVLVKSTDPIGELTKIIIRRVPVHPLFEIVQFAPGQSLQKILNTEIGQEGVRNDSLYSEYEVQPGNLVVLKFTDYPQDRRNLEYAISPDTARWSRLETVGNMQAFSMFSYLILNAPEPGRSNEILLRYENQKENIRKLKMYTPITASDRRWLRISAILVFINSILGLAYYFRKRKNKKHITALAQKSQDFETRLQLLNGQLNPHFLFNSLTAVQSLIYKGESEKANAYISSVAGFLRTIMETGQKTFISLNEEIETATHYMDLEQKRKAFRYEIHSSPGLDFTQIEFPPLLLQPILENSIRHGFGNTIAQPLLTIEIVREEKNLVVIIRDNGVGFIQKDIIEGYGLSITQKRINMLNEKLQQMKIEMFIQSQLNVGTITHLKFKNWMQ